jgi:hypothetical protein
MEAAGRAALPLLTSAKRLSGAAAEHTGGPCSSIGGTAGTAKQLATPARSVKRMTGSVPAKRSAGCVSELVTPIGLVRPGDRLEVRWIESGGDGEFYPATVVALSATGASVVYAETAEWNEWTERLELADRERLHQDFCQNPLLCLPSRPLTPSLTRHTMLHVCCGISGTKPSQTRS